MKKLDKLNLAYGIILPPSTSETRIQPCTLAITLLSLLNVTILSPIDPSSLPLLRSLHLSYQTCQPIRLLLLKIASLHLRYVRLNSDIDDLIQQSSSINSLSICEDYIPRVNEASRTAIKEKIVKLRLQFTEDGYSSDSTVAAIIAGSKVMKKVILDGFYLSVSDQGRHKFLETPKVVKEACKKKKIELWRENFDVGNGVVDLEK
jgi:hypothetical protein